MKRHRSTARLGIATALVAAAAGAGFIVTTAGAASAETVCGFNNNGTNPVVSYCDFGPKATDWKLTVTWKQGTDSTCAPGPTGDGWNCTAATPNQILTAAQSYVDPGNPDVTLSSDVHSIAIDLYKNDTNTSGRAASGYSYRHGARADCSSPAHPQSCAYPTSGQYDTYSFYDGGYFWAQGAYNYGWNDISGSCTNWVCGNVAGIPSDTLTATFPYQGLDGTRNGGLHLNPIVTNPTHYPPTITLGSPVGTTVHRAGPSAVDTLQSFAMTVTSPHGNNWTGSISVACPGSPTFTDNFFGLKYRAGQTAQSAPMTLPRANVTCTVTGNATDTSGTSSATASPVSGSFTYTYESAPSAPTLTLPTSATPIVHGTPIPFMIQSTDAENDTYSGSVTVYRNGTPVAGTGTFTTLSGAPSVGSLIGGLPAGSYTWNAIATDAQGVNSATSATGSFTVI